MIYYKTDEEIELIRERSLLVAKTLGEVAKHIKPGISTIFLDKIAEEFIRDHGAIPAFKGYNNFPNTLCTSLNSEVVHGIPSEKVILKEGDIILEFGSEKITAENPLAKIIMKYNPGDKVNLKVMRKDQEMNIEIELGERTE